jgi:hypothetical protein
VFKANLPKPDPSEVIDTLHGKLEDIFSIENSASQEVFAFVPTPGATFDRNSANNDPQDLRWAIDLQNPREFHDFDLTFSEGVGEFGLLIKDGIFYTFDRSDSRTLFVDRSRPGDVLPLSAIGTVINAIIPPPPANKSILVKYKTGGQLKTQELPRKDDQGKPKDPEGTFYSIDVANEPPSGTIDPDELDEYYQVLTNANTGKPIPANERFKLEMVHISANDGDRIPCMSVFLGG